MMGREGQRDEVRLEGERELDGWVDRREGMKGRVGDREREGEMDRNGKWKDGWMDR